MLISAKNPTEVEQLSQEMSSFNEWLIDNKLSLHLGKMESIVFASKRKLKINSNLSVACNGITISQKTSVKYLGAEIDQSLDGEPMACNVLSKVNARLKFLYQKSKYFDSSIRKLFVSSLVQCHYDYACSFWFASLTKRTKSKFTVFQK